MASVLKSINSLIPFVDPSRAVWKDVVYSLFLCTFLYFAPQIDRIWTHTHGINHSPAVQDSVEIQDGLTHPHEQPDSPGQPRVNIEEPSNQPRNIPPPFPTVEDELDEDFDFLDDVPQQDFQAADFVPDFPGEAAAGPAQPNQARRQRDPNRAVGAKKAKSIARRDRVRAYNEFLREQGNMQRAQDASTADQREKEQKAEQERRAKIEAEIEKKEKKRREEKKLKEEDARQQEADRVSNTISVATNALQSSGMMSMAELVKTSQRDAAWVESLLRKEDILGVSKVDDTKILTMLTSRGWIVRVSQETIKHLFQEAGTYSGATPGVVNWQELGRLLEESLRQQHPVSS